MMCWPCCAGEISPLPQAEPSGPSAAVLEDAQGLQLWGEHWWEAAWKQEDLENNPAPLVTPLGDLDDTIIATRRYSHRVA